MVTCERSCSPKQDLREAAAGAGSPLTGAMESAAAPAYLPNASALAQAGLKGATPQPCCCCPAAVKNPAGVSQLAFLAAQRIRPLQHGVLHLSLLLGHFPCSP